MRQPCTGTLVHNVHTVRLSCREGWLSSRCEAFGLDERYMYLENVAGERGRGPTCDDDDVGQRYLCRARPALVEVALNLIQLANHRGELAGRVGSPGGNGASSN